MGFVRGSRKESQLQISRFECQDTIPEANGGSGGLYRNITISLALNEGLPFREAWAILWEPKAAFLLFRCQKGFTSPSTNIEPSTPSGLTWAFAALNPKP